MTKKGNFSFRAHFQNPQRTLFCRWSVQPDKSKWVGEPPLGRVLPPPRCVLQHWWRPLSTIALTSYFSFNSSSSSSFHPPAPLQFPTSTSDWHNLESVNEEVFCKKSWRDSPVVNCCKLRYSQNSYICFNGIIKT